MPSRTRIAPNVDGITEIRAVRWQRRALLLTPTEARRHEEEAIFELATALNIDGGQGACQSSATPVLETSHP